MTGLAGSLSGAGTVAAFLLAVVFAVAAVVKATSHRSTVTELTGLRVPVPRLVARALPPVELAVAALLVASPRAGAVAAAGLLVPFTAVVGRAVLAGAEVSCGCLGSLSREPVSLATLARNGVLLALTVPALGATRPVVPDLAAVVAVSAICLAATVGVQLLSLRSTIGRLWSVELAGEVSTDGEGRMP